MRGVRAPLPIGRLTLESPVVLAPMAGYTDSAFRRICRRYGSALTFTEMVSAEGVARGSPRTLGYLETLPGDDRVAAHISGSDPVTMAKAAQRIAASGRFCAVDINCGCPVPKIVRKNEGVALMRDPGRVREIVAAICDVVDLPVTAKMRLGITPAEPAVIDIATAAAEGGASAVFVHARYATARHKGAADWIALRRIGENVGIPVIGNGGVRTAKDVLDMLDSGIDGVMIGRAAIGNPWLFAEAISRLDGTAFSSPSVSERWRTIVEHLRALIELMQRDEARRTRRKRREWNVERVACHRFRRHLIAYLKGAGNIESSVRQRLMSLDTTDALLGAVEQALFESPGGSQTGDAGGRSTRD